MDILWTCNECIMYNPKSIIESITYYVHYGKTIIHYVCILQINNVLCCYIMFYVIYTGHYLPVTWMNWLWTRPESVWIHDGMFLSFLISFQWKLHGDDRCANPRNLFRPFHAPHPSKIPPNWRHTKKINKKINISKN